ncbi:MAG TPA: ATP-binding protein [Burkholderiales bacterium]|nr:ATP-binding protein [Burkholderiales bacterium]
MKQKLINKDLFIDRINELEILTNGLKNGSDYILIAPRRYGKTTLVNKVFNNINKDKNYLLLSIDIMRYSGSIRHLAINITDKCLSLLGLAGKLYAILDKVELSLKLKVSWGDIELEPILKLLKSDPNTYDELKLLEHALELLEAIAIKKKKSIIVFFDEFGELYHLGESVVKLFRSVLQSHKHVSYIFAGSQETLMDHIFVDKNSAFFRFGTIINLGKLEEKEVLEYFMFAGFNFEISHKILDILKCHPYYTSKTIQDLHNNHFYAKDTSSFLKYLEQLLIDESSYLEMLIQKLSSKSYALDVLSNIARGVANNFGLEDKSRQYISNIISLLYKDGYIKKLSRGVYELTDPLLKLYLIS